MVEAYLRQSAVAHLGLEGRGAATRGEAGVAMSERPHRGIVNLRLDPKNAEAMAAFEAAFGFALPTSANDTAGDAALCHFEVDILNRVDVDVPGISSHRCAIDGCVCSGCCRVIEDPRDVAL